jgi:hypothetical protein
LGLVFVLAVAVVCVLAGLQLPGDRWLGALSVLD